VGSQAAPDLGAPERSGPPDWLTEAEDSLTAFVKRIRRFDSGREIRAFKTQLGRLSSALIRLAIAQGDHIHQIDTKVITAFDLWFPKDERQRVLWPSTIRLSAEYFDSLQAHAVPLLEESVAALAHSAVALDIYAWLAQRLHRIKPEKPAFIPWAALKEQFGPDYGHMFNFKRVFSRSCLPSPMRTSAAASIAWSPVRWKMPTARCS
jgi:Plasmid encoded RepA protein